MQHKKPVSLLLLTFLLSFFSVAQQSLKSNKGVKDDNAPLNKEIDNLFAYFNNKNHPVLPLQLLKMGK